MEDNKKGEGIKDQGKEISFQWFIITFLIHWKWFAISIILFLFGGFIRLRYSPPIYAVNANVILRDSKKGGFGNSELSLFEKLGYLEANNAVENEMEILKSRDLLQTVVIEEEAFIHYYVKGRFMSTELYKGSGWQFYRTVPVKVFIDKNSLSKLYTTLTLKLSLTENSTILVNGQYGSELFDNEFSSLPATIKTPIGELLLYPDENVGLKSELPLFIVINTPLNEAISYMGSLKEVLVNKNTSIVNLSLMTTNVKRGEDFLLRLFKVYNNETMDDKNKAAKIASSFIIERMKDINKDLQSSEGTIETYKKENKIAVDLGTEAGIYIGGDNEFSRMLVSLGTDEYRLSYLEKEVRNSYNTANLLPTALIDNAAISSSVDAYNKRILERERLLAFVKENAQIIVKANENINLLREDIITSIESLKFSYEISKREYEDMLYGYGADIEDIPRKERELMELMRHQTILSSLYSDLMRRKQEIDFTLEVSAPSLKVLESPMVAGQIAPRTRYVYFLCFVFGFMFPFVIIGLREFLNYKLSNEEEVRRFTELPVIVSLPIVKTKSPIVVSSHATTAIVERFRLLRTNLQFVLGDSTDKKSILITSTISGEGKTFVAINLAMIFSIKYKTILVGLDIRRPKINIFFNIPPKQMGLISYLTGDETDINNLIHRNVKVGSNETETNLDILTSGMIPYNPNELLMERTLDNMFLELRKQYDYIIIDSSPIGSVSDAFLLNRVCDVSIFIVRYNLTPKSAIALANKVYEEKRLNNLNLILNGFSGGKGRYGYGYGGYGYGGYGYGYGYGGYGYGYDS